MKKKLAKNFVDSKSCRNFAAQKGNGAMSEWLGTGLQNRLHQFESGWRLLKSSGNYPEFFCVTGDSFGIEIVFYDSIC